MAWKKNKKAAEEEITSSADPIPENNEAIFGDLWNNGENNEQPANEEVAEEQSAAEASSEEEFQLPDDGSIQIAYDADGNGYYISYDQETDQYFDPYSGDVYDISSLYDAEGNPFKFFATAEIPEESASESSASEAPANETLYEDSSVENQPAVQDTTSDNEVANDNLVNSSIEESASTESSTEPSKEEISEAPQTDLNQAQDQPQAAQVEPAVQESNLTPALADVEPVQTPAEENVQVAQAPQEEAVIDNNLSEQTTLSDQEPSEFSLNSVPSDISSAPDMMNELTSESVDNSSTDQTSVSMQSEPSNFAEIKNEALEQSGNNIEPVSQNQLPVENSFVNNQSPINLDQKSEVQTDQVASNFNVASLPQVQTPATEVQTPVNDSMPEAALPEVTVESAITQEVVQPVNDDNYQNNFSQNNFASQMVQPQENTPSSTSALPVVTESNNYYQPSAPVENIFIPSPQSTALKEQVVSSIPVVEQQYSNFAPTPEVVRPTSSFSVVENSAADNIFANKVDNKLKEQSQPDLNVNVREELTTEIFLDSVNDEVNQITNESKADYTKPLPINAVLNPPLSFEENSKEENESNKLHYIAYETPKVKSSFWSKYVGNEKYGHLDESGKWIWDGYFYDNEEFVSNKSVDNELAASPEVNDLVQDDQQVNYEEELKLDAISSDEDDNEEIIPISGSEPSGSVKTYTNSEYDSDIKILSDEQATKLLSDSDAEEVIDNQQVELISQEEAKSSKEKVEPIKDDEIIVEEILPQKTLMPEEKLASQNYKVVEEKAKELEVVEEQGSASSLDEEPLLKPNNLSTFEEPTNELEQLTSEIVSGDQTEISEDSLFKTEKYDEEVKKSFASTLDFLVKSKQEANTVYKKISKELRSEIDNLTKNIEKLKIEFKDNEGRIRSQKSEIMRSLSNDFNPGNNYTSGRDFDNLQHAQDYNKHLLQTIKDNETRLVVLVSNQKQLKVVYENRVIKINSDINKMQKIISNVNSTNYNMNLLSNNQSIINDNNNYQNQVNSFLPTPMNNYLTNSANSLIPLENTVGIYNLENDPLFDNNNISNILNDYQQRPLLSPTGLIQNQTNFNLSDSIFNKKPFSLDSNFSDPLAPLAYPSLDGYKSNYFDDDFETLVPDRTSSLDDLLGDNNSFITGTDELFNDNYDTKVSFTDDLENILSK